MTRLKLSVLTILFSIFLSSSLFCESLYNKEYDFYFDLPEGYQTEALVKKGQIFLQENVPYAINHTYLPVSLVLKICKGNEYTSSSTTMNKFMTLLSCEYDTSDYKWNDLDCTINTYTSDYGKGFALSVPLKEKKTYLVLLCYAPEENYEQCFNFIFSTLNSFCVNEINYKKPGPLITFLYSEKESVEKTVTIDNQTVNFNINKTDEEAAQFVVDLEYSVLTLYINNPLVFDAWSRYYRMIYRDNYGRLENFFENCNNQVYPNTIKLKPANPDLSYAQTVLSWVQTFEYRRNNEKASDSDFTNLVSAVLGKGCDCDSRSLLVCSLLKSVNLESFILYSPTYSHAMTTVYIDAPGQSFTVTLSDGQTMDFLMGETTAKVTWGLIPKEMADRNQWFAAFLP